MGKESDRGRIDLMTLYSFQNLKSMNRSLYRKLKLVLPIAVLIFFITSFVIGASRNISDVPFWDEWDSKLLMNPAQNEITWNSFWSQHNEHRIVVTKFFFLLDFLFFNGSSTPLIVLNLFLALSIFILICFAVMSHTQGTHNFNIYSAMALIGILNFSLAGSENLYWGFQSQFYFSILFPLLAFLSYCYYVSRNNRLYFYVALILGFLSIGTMASGLMAIPSLVLIQFVMRRPFKDIAETVVVGILTIVLYFQNFGFVLSSPIDNLLKDPMFVLKYNCLMLGSIIYNGTSQNRILTLAFVGLLYTIFALGILKLWKSRSNNVSIPLMFGVLIFTYFIGFSVLTASGRYTFGYGSALAGRYTLFSFTAISAAILVFFNIAPKSPRSQSYFNFTSFLLVGMLIPVQIQGLNANHDLNFQRKIAGLSLNLGADDLTQLTAIYPSGEIVIPKAQILIRNKTSIFGDPFFRFAAEEKSALAFNKSANKCRGNLEVAETVSPSSNFNIKVSGWAINTTDSIDVGAVFLSDSRMIVGYGLLGGTRIDVSNLYGKDYRRSGMQGYSSTKGIASIALVGQDLNPICEFQMDHTLF
jgi:hypothetical protein